MDVTVKALFRLLGTFLSGELHELPRMVMTLLPAGEWPSVIRRRLQILEGLSSGELQEFNQKPAPPSKGGALHPFCKRASHSIKR